MTESLILLPPLTPPVGADEDVELRVPAVWDAACFASPDIITELVPAG
jgi:hypothetical protein